jgi:tRNA (cmo5U34)-methyltransferase
VRQTLIDRIYERLHWGGALIMFEKVRAPDARFQDYATQIYTDYKLRRGYDENDRTQFDPGVAAALAAVVDA